MFRVALEEENLNAVLYEDMADERPKWKKLCTSLKEGICSKSLTMKPGEHNLLLEVIDDAGNRVEQSYDFTIEG